MQPNFSELPEHQHTNKQQRKHNLHCKK